MNLSTEKKQDTLKTYRILLGIILIVLSVIPPLSSIMLSTTLMRFVISYVASFGTAAIASRSMFSSVFSIFNSLFYPVATYITLVAAAALLANRKGAFRLSLVAAGFRIISFITPLLDIFFTYVIPEATLTMFGLSDIGYANFPKEHPFFLAPELIYLFISAVFAFITTAVIILFYLLARKKDADGVKQKLGRGNLSLIIAMFAVAALDSGIFNIIITIFTSTAGDIALTARSIAQSVFSLYPLLFLAVIIASVATSRFRLRYSALIAFVVLLICGILGAVISPFLARAHCPTDEIALMVNLTCIFDSIGSSAVLFSLFVWFSVSAKGAIPSWLQLVFFIPIIPLILLGTWLRVLIKMPYIPTYLLFLAIPLLALSVISITIFKKKNVIDKDL